jgi:histidine triad (HIT) family protein
MTPLPETSCIFCRVVQGTTPAEVLFENENVIVILDIHPIHYGHALVIPKTHCETFTDLPECDYTAMMKAMKAVSKAITELFHPEGYNIFSNNGEAAGQSVFHCHFHITPRYQNDNIKFILELKKYQDGEISRCAESLRQNIQHALVNES